MIEATFFITNTVEFLGIAITDSACIEIVLTDGLGEGYQTEEGSESERFHYNQYFNYPSYELQQQQRRKLNKESFGMLAIFQRILELQLLLILTIKMQKQVVLRPAANQFKTQEPENTNQAKGHRIASENPPKQLHHSYVQEQDEIYNQPTKVIRSSSSQYDMLIDQLYQSHVKADAKSYTKGKNVRQYKQEINFLKHPEKSNQYVVYCVATKQSSTGMVSHQRFFVLDSASKVLKYYSHVPHLPIRTLEDVGEEPKEIVELKEVKNFTVKNSKKGIGQLSFSWIDGSSVKEWKIKMANSTMSKQFAALVEEVRVGKPNVDRSMQKQKSRIKGASFSPKSKLVQVSRLQQKIKKSSVPNSPKNNNLADMLLLSMIAPEEKNKNISLESNILGKSGRSSHARPTNFEKKEYVESRNEERKERSRKDEKMLSREEPIKYNEQLKIDPLQPKAHTFDLKTYNQDPFTEEKKEEPTNIEIRRKSTPRIKIFSKVPKQYEKESVKESSSKKPDISASKDRIIPQQQKDYLSINKEEQRERAERARQSSLKMDQILKDASIQRIEYMTKSREPENAVPLSKTPVLISPSHESSKLSKLEQIVQKKRSLDESIKESSHRLMGQEGMELSKVMVKHLNKKPSELEATFKNVRGEQKSTINPQTKTSNSKYQTTSNRQNLLEERKYAQTFYDSRNMQRKVKVLNQHSHPRKQRGKSQSLSSQIDEYISQQKGSKEWLYQWLTAADSLKKGQIYNKFINHCKEKVKKLCNSFQNWHLFHKPGEQYVMKEEQIQFTYRMLKSQERISHSQEGFQEKMKNLQYLWNSINQLQTNQAQIKFQIPLACIITYKCLKIFCKIDLESSKLKHKMLTDFEPYQATVNKLIKVTKSNLKNCSVYSVVVSGKEFLYIDDTVVRPCIGQNEIYLNQNYMKKYVQGIISEEIHVQQIARHVEDSFTRDLVVKMQKMEFLSTLELEEQLYREGVDSSILPLLYKIAKQKYLINADKLILSSMCVQILTEDLQKLFHTLILSKNQRKNIYEHIHGMISRVLRLDDDGICQSLLFKKRINITLSELKQKIMDEYVICSIFIKMGIRCFVKMKKKLQDLESMKGSFWKEFQFNQNTIEFNFQPFVESYEGKYFNPEYRFFDENVFGDKQKRSKINIDTLYSKLHVKQGTHYHDSDCFQLLSQLQKEKINNFIADHEILHNKNYSLWMQEFNSPSFHLYTFTTSYFYCFQSFANVLAGIKYLVDKRQYKKAEKMVNDQLLRGWIWGRLNPLLLMSIYDLHALISIFLEKQSQSLESSMVCLKICLKAYEERKVSTETVLQKSFKAASIHAKFKKCNRAIELFTTCQKLSDSLIDKGTSLSLLDQYLSIYNRKVEMYLQKGDKNSAEEHLRSVMHRFSIFKQRYSDQKKQLINRIFEEEFETYSLLFRVYELQNKKIEMIQLMQDCSLKYIQTYIENLINNKGQLNFNDISQQCYRYFKQIIKNIWIAIVINCSQWKVSTYQHYFNYYYAPLKTIELGVIRNIIVEVRKNNRHRNAIQFKDAANYCFNLIGHNFKKYCQKQIGIKSKPKSLLVVALIDCLSILTQSTKSIKTQEFHQTAELQFLQSVTQCCYYEYTIGAIDMVINNYNTQL